VSAAGLQLQRFLPYRLSVLTNLVSSAIAAEYSQRFGLGIPEWRVLAVLAAEPGLSAAQVAARTAMDKVAVSRAVSRLLARGRLERRMAPGDRRKSLLSLSGEGAKIYAEVVPLALRLEHALLEVLDQGDRHAFERIIDRLLEHARTLAQSLAQHRTEDR